MTEVKIGDPELLKLAMKTIGEDLTRWDQQRYCDWGSSTSRDILWHTGNGQELVDVEACGTTFCLAGQVSLMAGAMPLKSGAWLTPEGGTDSAHELAQRALGLTYQQAEALFYRTSDGRGLPLNGSTPGAWDHYKRHVTQVTGVDFD